MSREAFVTLVEGEAYRRWYRERVFPSHERFARRHGRPLLVLEGPVRADSAVDHPHASWQKLRLFEAPELAAFDRLCWLDADLLAMRGAADPFAQAERGWVAVDNDTFGDARQKALDARWYWFLEPARRPAVLVNTGMMVLEREAHAAMLAAVWNTYGGRWDQAPLSFHLLQLRPGTLAPPELNLVVLHHLAREGHGPQALRSLVARPALLHFAGATVVQSPVYVAYGLAADAGDVAAMRALEVRQVETMVRWGIKRRLLAQVGRVATAAPEVASWLRRRALGRAARLLLSPHRTVEPGWTCVDVASADASQEKFAGGALAPSMPALEALEAGSGLEAVVLEHVLEEAVDPARALEAAARALGPGGTLQVLVAGPVEEGPPGFAAVANRRRQLSVERVRSIVADAGLRDAEVIEAGAVLELGTSRQRVPRAHSLVRWRR